MPSNAASQSSRERVRKSVAPGRQRLRVEARRSEIRPRRRPGTAPRRTAARAPHREVPPVGAGVDVVTRVGAVQEHLLRPGHGRPWRSSRRGARRAGRRRRPSSRRRRARPRRFARRGRVPRAGRRSRAAPRPPRSPDLHAGDRRRRRLVPGDGEEAGAADVVQVVPGVGPQRAVLPVAGDGAVDEPWVLGPERVVADPEPVDDARPEALDERVGVPGQPPDDLDAREGS